MGFCGIAAKDIKFPSNAGGILRAAGCYDADLVMFSGDRFARNKMRTDTRNSWKDTNTMWVEDIIYSKPLGVSLVAIDIVPDSVSLVDFVHPERALYIFGPEDGTLGPKILRPADHVVQIPTSFCMNLASCVNVVLYDRMQKEMRNV